MVEANVLVPFSVGVVVGIVAIPLLNRLARRMGAVSLVSADRWHRSGAIPRLAGPALFIALTPWLPGSTALVLGLFCLLGCVDDLYRLSARTKAVLMLGPALLGAWVTGQPWVAPALWIAANALNLLDHADGVAISSALVALGATATPAGWAGAGVGLAFLLFNFPPARSFLGDGGSLLLGGALVMLWQPEGPALTALWCAVPLADAALVILRRLWLGRKPWIGDTNHSAHILLRRGVPPWSVPFLYAATTAGLGVLGMRFL